VGQKLSEAYPLLSPLPIPLSQRNFTGNINVKTLQFTAAFKDDSSKLTELKQQISQKVIIIRCTVTFSWCASK